LEDQHVVRVALLIAVLRVYVAGCLVLFIVIYLGSFFLDDLEDELIEHQGEQEDENVYVVSQEKPQRLALVEVYTT
jgi:hypothetical protein